MSRIVRRTLLAFAAIALSAGVAGAEAVIEMRGAQEAAPQDYGYGRNVRAQQAAPIDLRRRSASMQIPAPVRTAPSDAVGSSDAELQRPEWLATERVGPPYEANGRWYAPTPEPGYQERGRAVRYPAERRTGLTATGEPFDDRALSAAHPTLPTPSLVQVTDLRSGRELIVRVTDRGPFGPGETIALSGAAADALGIGQTGEVHVRYLGPAPKRVAVGENSPQAHSSLRAPTRAPTRATQEPIGGVLVQVGVFSAEENARRAEQSLSALGHVRIEPTHSAGRALYRVRLGPWADADDAEAARARAVSLGFTGARLVRG